MPPYLPRQSACSIQTILASRPATSTARSAHLVGSISSRSHAQSFSSTSSSRAPIPVPPESPRYVVTTEVPQSSETKLPPVRGHLPVPRQIFSKKEGSRKVEPGYVARVAPLSLNEINSVKPKTKYGVWKQLMAQNRRESLAQGLDELWRRKQGADRRRTERVRKNFRDNVAAARSKEGADDILTRPSVRRDTADVTAVVRDPDAFEKALASQKRTSERAALKSEARRDALAHLYMSAKDFIVDEAELEAAIESRFKADVFQSHALYLDGSSLWETHGAPMSIQSMYNASTATDARGRGTKVQNISRKTTIRQLQVAEQLTGGKLDGN